MLVEGEGFEPSKAEPTDLQSAPFDRSGTPPNETGHYYKILVSCQTTYDKKLRCAVTCYEGTENRPGVLPALRIF